METVGTVDPVGTVGPVGPMALVLLILQFWLTLLSVLVILAIQLFAIQQCSVVSTELFELVSFPFTRWQFENIEETKTHTVDVRSIQIVMKLSYSNKIEFLSNFLSRRRIMKQGTTTMFISHNITSNIHSVKPKVNYSEYSSWRSISGKWVWVWAAIGSSGSCGRPGV